MAKRIDIEILRLAWPAIATNITTPLLSLVDVAIVGHIGSAAYIGAVAVGGAMLNMLYWLFGFLRAGTSGITAQATGAGDRQGQMLALARSLGSATIIGILIIVLSSSIGDVVLNFMDAEAGTASLARLYFNVAVLNFSFTNSRVLSILSYGICGLIHALKTLSKSPFVNSKMIAPFCEAPQKLPQFNPHDCVPPRLYCISYVA